MNDAFFYEYNSCAPAHPNCYVTGFLRNMYKCNLK